MLIALSILALWVALYFLVYFFGKASLSLARSAFVFFSALCFWAFIGIGMLLLQGILYLLGLNNTSSPAKRS